MEFDMQWNDIIIGQNTMITGDLKSITDIYISGQVSGTIYGDKNIEIDEHGVIKGDLECVECNLKGTLEGNVKAKKIYLLPSAKLMGNITSTLLKIDEGAVFVGSSKKSDPKKDSKLISVDPVYEI
jgi:cytoskeletal protein CcmA (bactofilin family)